MCSKPFYAVMAVVLAMAPMTGCGRSNGRFGLSGSVRLDGVSIDGGTIELTPVDGPVLTTAGSVIVDGRYTVTAKQGLLPGIYRVRVFWAERPNGPGTIGGVSAPPPQERIPDRYNSKSELTVEVQAHSANRFDFDLSTEAR